MLYTARIVYKNLSFGTALGSRTLSCIGYKPIAYYRQAHAAQATFYYMPQ